jgi:glycosyltransferase involved in cell wall biosynthesis
VLIQVLVQRRRPSLGGPDDEEVRQHAAIIAPARSATYDPGVPEPVVSVIVPARNAARQLPRLLDALAGQATDAEFEVIVVSDGSTDDTERVVRERDWPRLLAHPSPRGSAAARNTGAREARAPLLAFTDADCIPAPDWVERGLRHFREEPELTALAGEVVIAIDERATLAALVDAASFLYQRGNARRGFAVTASMWVRHDAFERAGGFNEALRWSHSDKEFGCYITALGGTLRHAEDVVVHHPPRATGWELARKAYRLGRGHAALRRHARSPVPGADRPFIVNPRRYLPAVALRRLGRLRERGVRFGPARAVGFALAEFVFVSIPRLAGDAVGTVAAARERARLTGSR